MPWLEMDSTPSTTAAAVRVAAPEPGLEEGPVMVFEEWPGFGVVPRAAGACPVGEDAAWVVAFLVAAAALPAKEAAAVEDPGVELAGPCLVGHAVGLASSSPVVLIPSSWAERERERERERKRETNRQTNRQTDKQTEGERVLA